MVVLRFHKYTIFIDEAGLYKLLTNSTKELAKKFRDEVFSNILPTIRKTGSYNVVNKDKLKKFRSCGLEKGGEFSYENIVFKYLRRSGHIEKLFNLENQILDKELSLSKK